LRFVTFVRIIDDKEGDDDDSDNNSVIAFIEHCTDLRYNDTQ